jgi:flagellar basal-body rod modification protein FlgD
MSNVQLNPASVIAPLAANALSARSTESAGASRGLDDSNLFITLLTTQLQAQDPLSPMSPQDMVAQLTQVSSLEQLISINKVLQGIAGATGDATQASQ